MQGLPENYFAIVTVGDPSSGAEAPVINLTFLTAHKKTGETIAFGLFDYENFYLL